MAFKSVDDMLKHPEAISPRHNCELGELLKWQGLLVAKGMHMDFNSMVRQAIQAFVKDFKRKNKSEWEQLNRQYGGLFSKKKG